MDSNILHESTLDPLRAPSLPREPMPAGIVRSEAFWRSIAQNSLSPPLIKKPVTVACIYSGSAPVQMLSFGKRNILYAVAQKHVRLSEILIKHQSSGLPYMLLLFPGEPRQTVNRRIKKEIRALAAAAKLDGAPANPLLYGLAESRELLSSPDPPSAELLAQIATARVYRVFYFSAV